MRFSLEQSGIASSLISVASLENLEWNLSVLQTPLTEEEEKISKAIYETYLKPLKSAEQNWLKVEVVRYWTSMKECGAEQPMDR